MLIQLAAGIPIQQPSGLSIKVHFNLSTVFRVTQVGNSHLEFCISFMAESEVSISEEPARLRGTNKPPGFIQHANVGFVYLRHIHADISRYLCTFNSATFASGKHAE